MIDPDKPMELSDGTPVTFVRVVTANYSEATSRIAVKLPEGVVPSDDYGQGFAGATWHYWQNSGRFVGHEDDGSYAVLRNVPVKTPFIGKRRRLTL